MCFKILRKFLLCTYYFKQNVVLQRNNGVVVFLHKYCNQSSLLKVRIIDYFTNLSCRKLIYLQTMPVSLHRTCLGSCRPVCLRVCGLFLALDKLFSLQ